MIVLRMFWLKVAVVAFVAGVAGLLTSVGWLAHVGFGFALGSLINAAWDGWEHRRSVGR